MTRKVEQSPLQEFCLERLRRFVALDRGRAAGDDADRQRLVRAALLSALRDCRALGLAEPAARILASAPSRNHE